MPILNRIICAALLILLSSVGTAHASVVLQCRAVDGRSGEITINMGRLVVLSVLRAEVTAFGKTWSTADDAENPIIVGQGVDNKDGLQVDFTDPNVENIFISLRTASISTKKEYAEAGVLRIGEAVYPVICEEG